MPELFAIKSEPLRQLGIVLAAVDRVPGSRKSASRSPFLAVLFQQFDGQADVGAGDLEAQCIEGGNILAKRTDDLDDARVPKVVFPWVFNHRATDLPEVAEYTGLQLNIHQKLNDWPAKFRNKSRRTGVFAVGGGDGQIIGGIEQFG